MPVAVKLDHLQLIKPLLFPNFYNFCTFILGGQFLLPQRANNRKRGILTTSKLDDTDVFQCLGHSNWTICSPLSHFCFQIFTTFTLSYWEAISYYPRVSSASDTALTLCRFYRSQAYHFLGSRKKQVF